MGFQPIVEGSNPSFLSKNLHGLCAQRKWEGSEAQIHGYEIMCIGVLIRHIRIAYTKLLAIQTIGIWQKYSKKAVYIRTFLGSPCIDSTAPT